jgi:hypothetical protein
MHDSDFTLLLSEDERLQLLNILAQSWREKQMEAHRTASAEYRKYVEHQESVVENLISKLKHPTVLAV